MNQHLSKYLLWLTIIFTSANSYALPIGWSLDVNGSSRVITSDTGTRWLSPFSSDSLSWNDVVLAQNAGPSIFDGYRRANTNEFLDLVSAYGMTPTPSWAWASTTTSELNLINEFQQDFGLTYEASSTHAYTYGALINATTGLQTLAIVGQYQNQKLLTPYYHTWGNDLTKSSSVGQWLIADSVQVPEPSILALIGLGLAGIGFKRKHKA